MENNDHATEMPEERRSGMRYLPVRHELNGNDRLKEM